MISIKNISKSFDEGQSHAVREVSLEVETGETLVLLGSSGSGKSTLLKLINLLIQADSGEICIDGQLNTTIDPVVLRRSIGYVFQGVGLFPHMTVEENIAIVLRLEKQSRQLRRIRARELMDLVNLDAAIFAERFPEELSGGQQQRVGVARALANEADILLMDEPFGALDAINRDALQQEFLKLKAQLKKTVVFVTHDVIEALLIADRIAVMDQGCLQQVGTPKQIIENPATVFVKHLFEKAAEQFAVYEEQLA